MQLLEQSWQRAWAALGATPPRELFDQLIACYSEPHRQYHTLQHLSECLEQLELVLKLAGHPGEVEVALWFHDAIYEFNRQDNEERSADWAKSVLKGKGLLAEVAERVFSLVMATRHSALPASMDERLLVDIDLSILGSSPQRFAEYEQQIRKEYSWVPQAVFNQKRRAVLQGFIDRPSIYSTDYFRARFEQQARRNLLKVANGA